MNEAEIKNKMLSLEEKIFAEKLPEEMVIWNNKPVSYTHLDVYKRQLYSFSCSLQYI